MNCFKKMDVVENEDPFAIAQNKKTDPIDNEDPFSLAHMPTDSFEVTIEDINRLDEDDSLDEIDGVEDDLTILEIAMAKAIENVNPAIFMHLLCPRCGETFHSSAHWQQHLHNVHYFNNLKMLPGTVNEGGTIFYIKFLLHIYLSFYYYIFRRENLSLPKVSDRV